MARKSRKHQTVALPHLHSETAGYIRLSVTGKGGDDSIENQKKVIEAWAQVLEPGGNSQFGLN